MTLILGYSSVFASVMVSDRLTTLQRHGRYGGPHDTISNKHIVLITTDAAVSIGYTGRSFIGDLATDKWIAYTVAYGGRAVQPPGLEGIYGFKTRSTLRLHQICNHLRMDLGNRPDGNEVELLITGYRVKRRKIVLINIRLSADRHLRPNPGLKLRNDFPIRNRVCTVGQNLIIQEKAICKTICNSYPSWDVEGIIPFPVD